MKPSIQVEPWSDCKEEARSLWPAHYEENGQDKARMKLDPNVALIDRIEQMGNAHIVTVRAGGELVGYHGSVIEPLLHYQSIIAGKSDLFWLRPDMRRGRLAIDLFKEVERSSRARGVDVLYDATKLNADCGRLFEYLGYSPIERRYSKWIGAS